MAFIYPPNYIRTKSESNYKACAVIVSYDVNGLMKPMYVKFTNDKGEIISLKVDYARPCVDLIFALSITFIATLNGKQVQSTIKYIKDEYRWVIVC